MIKQKILNDQLTALKQHDQEKLFFLRYILAQIKNKEIDKKSSQPEEKPELTDAEVVAVLRKISKELTDAIEAFKLGKRQDLVDKNQQQLKLVSSYLPQELSDQELKKAIDRIIAANKDSYQANPKALIGICVRELKSKADPARIVRILNSLSKL